MLWFAGEDMMQKRYLHLVYSTFFRIAIELHIDDSLT
jgi:hypothetical protein